MRHRAASLGALLALLAIAATADAAVIQGRVVKGMERTPASGVPVSLHPVKNEQELPGQTVASGPDGTFRFTGVTQDPSTQFFLSTEYEGAFYTEGPVEFTGDLGAKDIQIFDVGNDMSSVRVTNHHILVERAEDHLHITEILIFQNDGPTAYLGTGLNHAENVGVRIGLPASVKKFEQGMGGDEGTVQVQGRDLSSHRPIPPGQRPFSFSYEIPLSARMDLSHRIYFPTESVDILINDPELKVEGSSLTYTGAREQNGKKFEIYQAKNLPVGSELTMRVHGAGFWSNPKIYPWVVAPFVIVAVLIFASRRGRKSDAPVTRTDPRDVTTAPAPMTAAPPKVAALAPHSNGDDDLHVVYLFLIDALDKGLEQGEFTRESHDLVRGNLKRRLETILSDRTPTPR